MTLPKQVLPNTTYLVTRRCTQRLFLLKPSPLNTQIFAYCLAVAAKRMGMIVHAVVVTSNHYHVVLTDPDARLPEFTAYLHKLVAKCVNASLGRWENLWSSEKPSTVRLENAEDVQSHTDSPSSREPRRNLNPQVACRSKWYRIEALQRLKSFQSDYKQAPKRWRDGERSVVFPAGTYAMRVHAGVKCEPTQGAPP